MVQLLRGQSASSLKMDYVLRSSKNLSERKRKNQYRGKSYSALADRGKQVVSDEKRLSGGETPASIKCFKYGELDHRDNECKNKVLRCFKCGKTDHSIVDCKSDGPTCYNCNEQGHISTNCQKPNKVSVWRESFALTRSETTSSYRLI
ncbi:uncharacterized protein LOC127101833 [Lathyrus oleraceus]|uniref:uncharacterized protein LOC127101833 n=1 Tax=Pisum sativum TaxID=3888 RepID=UPI0021D0BA51|nr:uncharacterized protein LOC127101833 [Pisum sativum]